MQEKDNTYLIDCQPSNPNYLPIANVKLLKSLARSPLFTSFFNLGKLGRGVSSPDIWGEHHHEITPNCPLGVPANHRERVKIPSKCKGPRQDPKQRFPKLAAEMEAGKISYGTLCHATELHLAQRPTIMFVDDEGGADFFKGSVRGDPTYSKKLGLRIAEASATLQQIPGSTVFITITYAVNQETPNMFDAQSIHSEVVDKFLRHCRAQGNFHYICVLEQTAKGYPHVHILCKWEGKFFKFRRDSKGRLILKNRTLYKKIKGWQPYPQFKLLGVEDDKASYYITKYVSKGLVSPNRYIGQLSEKDMKEQRKSMLCYIIGYMAHARQFRISKSLRKVPESQKITHIPADKDTLDAMAELDIVSKETFSVLIYLLNKLTSVCRAHAYACYNPRKQADFVGLNGYIAEPPDMLIRSFKQASYPLGCPGCIVTRFLDGLDPHFDLITVSPRPDFSEADRLASLAIKDSSGSSAP
jgi:hypothetical protein